MDSSEPIESRYLWGYTSTTVPIPIGTAVSDRYRLVAPNIWLDSSPQVLPAVKEPLIDEVFPYLQLYPYRLHVPEVETVVEIGNSAEVILLNNVPIDKKGNLMPSIIEAWSEASSVQKLDWLWQILDLWAPLSALQAVSSLAIAENLRVDGWRVRLLQLDLGNPDSGSMEMQKLGKCWESWFGAIDSPINLELEQIYQIMQLEDISVAEVQEQVNQLLLLKAQSNFFQVEVASATDTGTQRQHNEDACYPLQQDLDSNPSLATSLAIVCDGVGGHEAGEIASSMAVSSIKLQLQALLSEFAKEPEFISPEIVSEILTVNVRVANNLIVARNDEQGRDLRQRMATTLVMAVQLPEASGEVYIVSVGDSRAYWLSERGIVQLTIDDNVITEAISEGKSLMADAVTRQDAAALTQALGVQLGEFIYPRVKRLIVPEEGLLLLCSDGLSDNELVELHGREYVQQVISGDKSLNEVLKSLMEFANGYNGHDNISVVLTHFKPGVRPPAPEVAIPATDRVIPSIPEPIAIPAPAPAPVATSINRSLAVTFAIASLAIAGTVFLALAMLSDRLRQPQIERSPQVETPQ